MKKSAKIIVGIAALLTTMNCAKRPYDEAYKAQTHSKTLLAPIDGKKSAHYLYLPSVLEIPRKSKASIAFEMGEPRTVTLRFHENELLIEGVEKEDRFGNNPQNAIPVATIPVITRSFRCKENSNGECTNEEEENTETLPSQREFFEPLLDQMKVEETNLTSLDLENFFGSCFAIKSKKVVSYEVSPGVLNITVDQYLDDRCADLYEADDLKNIAQKIRLHYSIVAIDQLSSKDYIAINYPTLDEDTFGFFTTYTQKLSPDNRDEKKNEKILMNRWNPEKREVVYYLNDAFNKPENASILKVTEQAIERINRSLEIAGTSLQLKTEKSQGKNPGDLRHNMIVLVEDPVDTGIIGYGPSVANPETGEIVQGRVVMYSGTIRKFLYRTYEEFATHLANKKKTLPTVSGESTSSSTGAGLVSGLQLGETHSHNHESYAALPMGNSIFSLLNSDSEKSTADIFKMSQAKLNHGSLNQEKLQKLEMTLHTLKTHRLEKADIFTKIRNWKEQNGGSDWWNRSDQVELMKEARTQLELQRLRKDLLVANCAYTQETFNFDGAVESAFSQSEVAQKLFEIVGATELPPWEALSLEQQEKVLDLLLPFVYTQVFVHEMGHNLGLRHNFSASEDKDNFYTAEELKGLGVDVAIPYSSVMDYAYSNINELPIMGKYDIAALRFGYARKVEAADGSLVAVSTTLDQIKNVSLKSYMFCTDSGVGASPNCNTFDEGITLPEIAKHKIKVYKERYKRANLRNGRRNFRLSDEINYAIGIFDQYFDLQVFAEYRKLFKEIEPRDELWLQFYDQRIAASTTDAEKSRWTSAKEFFLGIRESAKIVADFFLDIIKTPNGSCLVLGSGGLGLAPLEQFGSSCMETSTQEAIHAALRAQGSDAQVVGQIGKSFNSYRAPGNTDKNANEIDVRGIWIDKLLAVQMLLIRDIGLPGFAAFNMNALDTAENYAEFYSIVDQILHDQLNTKVEAELLDGSLVELSGTFSLADSHLIPENGSRILRAVFMLPRELTHFQKVLLDQVRALHPSTVRGAHSLMTLSPFVAYRDPPNGLAVERLASLGASQVIYATEDNILAHYLASAFRIASDLNGFLTNTMAPLEVEFGIRRVSSLLTLASEGKPIDELPVVGPKEIELKALMKADILKVDLNHRYLQLLEVERILGRDVVLKAIQAVINTPEEAPLSGNLEQALRELFTKDELKNWANGTIDIAGFMAYRSLVQEIGIPYLKALIGAVMDGIPVEQLGTDGARAQQLVKSKQGIGIRHYVTGQELLAPSYYAERLFWLPEGL